MKDFLNYEWEHAMVVADRCAKRFNSRTDIERYLMAIGWQQNMVEKMLKYLDRKERKENI